MTFTYNLVLEINYDVFFNQDPQEYVKPAHKSFDIQTDDPAEAQTSWNANVINWVNSLQVNLNAVPNLAVRGRVYLWGSDGYTTGFDTTIQNDAGAPATLRNWISDYMDQFISP
jgi:hypothetical protein